MPRLTPIYLTILIQSFIVLFIPSLYGSNMPLSFEWQFSKPEEQGISSSPLDALVEILRSHATDGVLIIRHDRVVREWYSEKLGPNQKHGTASLAKALVGGLSLVLALNDGLIQIDDPASSYVPAWKDDPTRAGITIRHLATHSSGIEDAEVQGMGHFESGGWKTRFWKQDPDPFTIARDWAPMKFKPGAAFEYSNPGMAMLSYAITSALQKSQYKDVRTYLRERIMRPIGVPDAEWSIGYGKTFSVDGLDLVANWGGGAYTARAAARVGRLMLRQGEWEGARLLDAEWVKKVTSDAGTPEPFRGAGEGPCPKAGLAWWVNADGILSRLPRDAFMGAGAGNQVLIVVPSLDLVAVRFGGNLDPASFWGGLETYFFNPLMDAVQN